VQNARTSGGGFEPPKIKNWAQGLDIDGAWAFRPAAVRGNLYGWVGIVFDILGACSHARGWGMRHL